MESKNGLQMTATKTIAEKRKVKIPARIVAQWANASEDMVYKFRYGVRTTGPMARRIANAERILSKKIGKKQIVN